MFLAVAISWGCKMIPRRIACIEIYCSISLLSAHTGCLTWSSKHPKPLPVLHWFCMVAATSSILHKEFLLGLLNWHVTLQYQDACFLKANGLLPVDYTRGKTKTYQNTMPNQVLDQHPWKTLHSRDRRALLCACFRKPCCSSSLVPEYSRWRRSWLSSSEDLWWCLPSASQWAESGWGHQWYHCLCPVKYLSR